MFIFPLHPLFPGVLCFVLFAQAIQGLSQHFPQERKPIEVITRRLSAPEFNGRKFNSEGGFKAAGYIADLFSEAGLKFVQDPGRLIVTRSSYLSISPGAGTIVFGMVEGRDAALKNEYVIVGAHYDGFGDGFAGAMDNAAGVAVMIEIARALAKNPPQRSVVFIAFDGGEQNDARANFYAEHPIAPAANIAFYIANPNGVEYTSLLNQAHTYEDSGQRQQAIAAYQKVLKFIEEEYRQDDKTIGEIRSRLTKLQAQR